MPRVILIFALAAGLGFAQQDDPCKLEFENDWVRISRVTYGPFQKSQTHAHPELPTVYVYTTDGGPMTFVHSENIAIDRGAVKAGGIRFNRGNHERHYVENLTAIPSEYLRIELKTEPLELPNQDIRIAPTEDRGYENAQIRIEKSVCAPDQKCGSSDLPSVIVTLTDHKATWVQNGFPVVKNTTAQPTKVIQVGLKSPPKAKVP